MQTQKKIQTKKNVDTIFFGLKLSEAYAKKNHQSRKSEEKKIMLGGPSGIESPINFMLCQAPAAFGLNPP